MEKDLILENKLDKICARGVLKIKKSTSERKEFNK